MAQEILILDSTNVLFFLRFKRAPIVVAGEAQVIGNTSAALPANIEIITQQIIADIDAGLLVWERVPVKRHSDDREDLAAYETRLRAKWQSWKKETIASVTLRANELARVRWLDVE